MPASCRYGFFKLDGSKPAVHVLTSAGFFGAATALSLIIKDLGLLIALPGALLGTSLVYIFPALMAIGNARQAGMGVGKGAAARKGAKPPAVRTRGELLANYGLVALGVALSVVGGTMTWRDYLG